MKNLLFLFMSFLLLSCNFKKYRNFEKELNSMKKIENAALKTSDIYKKNYPILILSDGYLNLYEKDEGNYKFKKRVKAKQKYNENIRAAFPIPEFDFKTMCLVSANIFENEKESVLIFHEFVHVYQAENFETKIKEKLEIYQQAFLEKDWMWEINYDFPYKNEEFINLFSLYLEKLEAEKLKEALYIKEKLKMKLSKKEYEYLVWQEFKEGSARYIENEINKKMNFPINNYGENKPFNRISFYASGSKLIELLYQQKYSLKDPMKLFAEINLSAKK